MCSCWGKSSLPRKKRPRIVGNYIVCRAHGVVRGHTLDNATIIAWSHREHPRWHKSKED